MDSTLKNEQGYTYTDYITWPEDERWEIIDGTAYAMSPAPSPEHQRISGNLFTEFKVYLKDRKCEVFFAPFDVRLPKSGETGNTASNVVQPDLVIICDPNKIDDRGCKGSPDLIIEVLSPSTSKNDKFRKLNLYEHHGVLEYWIVDPFYQVIDRFFYDRDLRKYKRPDCFLIDDAISPVLFPDLAIKLNEVFRAN